MSIAPISSAPASSYGYTSGSSVIASTTPAQAQSDASQAVSLSEDEGVLATFSGLPAPLGGLLGNSAIDFYNSVADAGQPAVSSATSGQPGSNSAGTAGTDISTALSDVALATTPADVGTLGLQSTSTLGSEWSSIVSSQPGQAGNAAQAGTNAALVDTLA